MLFTCSSIKNPSHLICTWMVFGWYVIRTLPHIILFHKCNLGFREVIGVCGIRADYVWSKTNWIHPTLTGWILVDKVGQPTHQPLHTGTSWPPSQSIPWNGLTNKIRTCRLPYPRLALARITLCGLICLFFTVDNVMLSFPYISLFSQQISSALLCPWKSLSLTCRSTLGKDRGWLYTFDSNVTL